MYIYIAKAGFAPYVYIDDRTHHIFQGETIEGDIVIDNGEIIAGENVTDTKPTGAVTFDGGNIELKTSTATFENSIEIKRTHLLNLLIIFDYENFVYQIGNENDDALCGYYLPLLSPIFILRAQRG